MSLNQNERKPDSVVFNEDTQRYDAFLRPYATDRAAPRIDPELPTAWKRKGAKAVNDKLSAEFEELRKKYEQLRERIEYNRLVYNARFQFEPVVGQTYFLYRDRQLEPFLSLIPPQECRFEFLGAFRLQSDLSWLKVETRDELSMVRQLSDESS